MRRARPPRFTRSIRKETVAAAESVTRNDPTLLRDFNENGPPTRAGVIVFGLTVEILAESVGVSSGGSLGSGWGGGEPSDPGTTTVHSTELVGLSFPAASICLTASV